MDGGRLTEGERRAAEEFADAVREEAARFFNAMVEEMRRHPEEWRLRREPLPEREAAALAVESVREVRRELWGGRDPNQPLAPTPTPEDVKKWELAREERRKREGYQPS